VYAVGSSSTNAALADFLLERRPRVLLLDELEKINLWYTVILLSLTETGIVTETKHRRRREEHLNRMAVTTANRID